MGQGCPKNETGEDAQGIKWAEDAQGIKRAEEARDVV